MRKMKLPIAMLLVFCLVFSNVSMAFADTGANVLTPPIREIKDPGIHEGEDPITNAIEPGDVEGGGHLCDYHNISHIVTAIEAYNSNFAVNALVIGLNSLCPQTLVIDILNLVSGGTAVFIPIEGDKVIETWSISYNPTSNSYDYVYREYVYRPTWGGGQTLMYQYYFTDNYNQYEGSYSLYQQNCPH